jgi:hypothetical protein
MIPAMPVVNLNTSFPVTIISVFPALMGIDGDVTVTSRMGREPGVETPLVITGVIVVTEVVMAVAWPQEKAVKEYIQVNHHER